MILKHCIPTFIWACSVRYHQYGELTFIIMGKCEDFTHCEINGANKKLFVSFYESVRQLGLATNIIHLLLAVFQPGFLTQWVDFYSRF